MISGLKSPESPLCPDLPPIKSNQLAYQAPNPTQGIPANNSVKAALDVLLENAEKNICTSAAGTGVEVFDGTQLTPPVVGGSVLEKVHVFKRIAGALGIAVGTDPFNSSQIRVSLASNAVDNVLYDTPFGATASVPPGSNLKVFLDLVSLFLFQHQLQTPAFPPPGPSDSFADLDQSSVTVNTGTNPDTKFLNLKYLHSTNSRLQLSNTAQSAVLDLNLPTHRTWYWSRFGQEFDLVIGPEFDKSIGTRWQVEIDTSTVNNGVEDGWKHIRVNGFDLDGSYIDETKIQFVASVRDDAIECARQHHIEVCQSFGDLTLWLVRTTQWDGSQWVGYNTRFYLRLFLANQPNS